MKITANGKNIKVENIRDLQLRCNFEDILTGLEFDFDSLVVPKPYNNVITDWELNGGGVGVGIPTLVTIENTTLPAYLDLTDSYVKRTRNSEVRIKKRLGADNFLDYAQGVTFEWLNAQGVDFEAEKIKYLIVPENQGQIALSLFIALFMTGTQAYNIIKEIADLTAEGIAIAQIDPVGAGSQAVAVSLRLVYLTTYLAIVLGLTITLLRQIKELVFPKIRELYAPRIKKLIQKACEFKGYTLQSSLLDEFDNLSIIPVPKTKNKQSIFRFLEQDRTDYYNNPFPTSMDFCNTLYVLIEEVLKIFNAEIRINNGVVKIETESTFINQASINFVEMFNLQDKKQLESSYNTNEIYTRYYLNYSVDQSDTHTSNDLNNTFTELGAKNSYQTDQDLNLLKGLYQRQFLFSLGSIKTDLTTIENIALTVFKSIDFLLEQVKGSSNLGNIITNRQNILQISNQFFSNTKIYRNGSNGKVASNYSDVYTPQLWNNYHYLRKQELYGWETYENMPTVINLDTALSLLDNNYCLMNGTIVKIVNFTYNWRTKIGNITYRKRNNYLQNKVITFNIA
jgi:hypothetical protein